MNILVIAPYAINTPHFETELEIIQNCLDTGHRVTLLGCDAHLECCDVNFNHNILNCLNCISRRHQGVHKLANSERLEVKPLYFINESNQKELQNLNTNFLSIEALKKFKVDNFDIGYGVLSSIVSGFRDSEPHLPKYYHIIHRLMTSSLAVYRSIRNYLQNEKFDRVYTYNGRYAPLRAVLRACQAEGVECWLHEKGRTLQHYSLIKDTLPHDPNYIQNQIKESWKTALNNPEREKIASQFYIDRIKGISHTWFSFTKEQQEGLLPNNWNKNKNNIAIFISSEDEFVAIGDSWLNPIYRNQIDGLNKIIQSLEDSKNIHLYLRVHPNLKNVKNKQTEEIYSLRGRNLTIIPADSSVSTYTLLYHASKVLTFGSTVGIEAAYWGIPSILAGQSFYRNLGSTYNPKNHEELIEMLQSDLPPHSKEGALMYGYYMETKGIAFRHYQALGIYEGLFKGSKIESKPTLELLVELGIKQLNLGRYNTTLQLLETALKTNPNLVGINYPKAIALARLGQTQKAIETVNYLLSVLPNHQKGKQLLRELNGTNISFNENRSTQNYLNLGCGYHIHPAWTNVDFSETRPGVIAHDLRQGIPFPDESFEVVYHSHVLEHLPKTQAEPFLRECYRVLKNNGIIRVVVPDLEQIARLYLTALEKARQGSSEWAANYDWVLLEMYDQVVRNYSGGDMAAYLAQPTIPNERFVLERTGVQGQQMIQNLRKFGYRSPSNTELTPSQIGTFRYSGEVHQWMYDSYSLSRLLQKVGFRNITVCGATESRIPNFEQYHLDTMPDGRIRVGGSLFMEALK